MIGGCRTFLVRGGEIKLAGTGWFKPGTYARDQHGKLWFKSEFDAPWQRTSSGPPDDAEVEPATFLATG